GGSYQYPISLPQTFKDIQIVSSLYIWNTDAANAAMPLYESTYVMYGVADIEFEPGSSTCTLACSGKACGASDGCGGTCCAGSGSTPAGCGACQPANACGTACVAVADGTSCSGGTCQAGSCVAVSECTTLSASVIAGSGSGSGTDLTCTGDCTIRYQTN